MRKLIAVISTLVTALAVLTFGLTTSASATVTSPGNGAVLRGNATLSETGGFDDSTLDHCSWFGGDGGNTRLQLINSGGTILINTPKLPEAPLILIARALLATVALQVVLFGVWVATGAGPAGVSPFGVLVGPWAMFVWLRLIVGLVFPLIVSWAAVKTARTRSMESATGLLYINVGSIAAGTILAAGLYFGAGLLV